VGAFLQHVPPAESPGDRLDYGVVDKLADVLKRFGDKRAMNLETLDGFFAALICGPDNVPPSEYLPEIWGGDMVNEPAFQTKQILQEFISLVTRHWNATCDTLQSGNVFLPLLLDDESGVARANDWANGFMRGMEMRISALIGSLYGRISGSGWCSCASARIGTSEPARSSSSIRPAQPPRRTRLK
jgi:Uncharacterised protein family (UPF0149)